MNCIFTFSLKNIKISCRPQIKILYIRPVFYYIKNKNKKKTEASYLIIPQEFSDPDSWGKKKT